MGGASHARSCRGAPVEGHRVLDLERHQVVAGVPDPGLVLAGARCRAPLPAAEGGHLPRDL